MEPLKMPARMAASLLETAWGRLVRGPARPNWSFGFETMARTMRRTGLSIGRRPPAAQRRAWEELGRSQPNRLRREIDVEPVDAGGVACRRVVPRGVGADAPLLVYLHGGAYRYGSWTTHGELTSRLARAAQAQALFVEYRLCPEHPFPAAVDDTLAAVRWALARTPPSRVVVGGDSAGGALALAALIVLRDAGGPLPAAGLCLCPWTSPATRGGSLVENARWDWAAPEEFEDWVRTYAGGSVADPRVSPANADLRGLPPLLLQVGGAEMLHDQVVAFARKAQAAGVDATLSVAPDMIHDWHSFASLFEASRRAIDECGAFVRARTARPA